MLLIIPPKARYGLLLFLAAALLAYFISASLRYPARDMREMWIVITAMAYVFVAICLRNRRLLTIARLVCYGLFVGAGIALIVGIVGAVKVSTNLVIYLVNGTVYGFIAAIYLAGVSEAELRAYRRGRC
jgi:hypothetical protein